MMISIITLLTNLFKAALKKMSEVLDGVVPVLVERPEQLLEALLNPVRVGWVLVEGVGEAGHGHLFALEGTQIVILEILAKQLRLLVK